MDWSYPASGAVLVSGFALQSLSRMRGGDVSICLASIVQRIKPPEHLAGQFFSGMRSITNTPERGPSPRCTPRPECLPDVFGGNRSHQVQVLVQHIQAGIQALTSTFAFQVHLVRGYAPHLRGSSSRRQAREPRSVRPVPRHRSATASSMVSSLRLRLSTSWSSSSSPCFGITL